MMMSTQILLLGVPGTGATCLAEQLSAATALPLFSFARPAGTDDHGMDDPPLMAIEKSLRQSAPGNGFILRGFPATLPQAQSLDQILAWHGFPVTRVVMLKLPHATLLERIQGRRRCIECGESINQSLPAIANRTQCPFCGAALERLRPENDITDEQTLAAAERQLTRLGRYYRTQNKLLPVDVTGDAGTDLAKVQEALQRRNRL